MNRRGKIDPRTYDGQHDAEFILETVMKRTRWAVADRDALAECLTRIAGGHHLETLAQRRDRALRNKRKEVFND